MLDKDKVYLLSDEDPHWWKKAVVYQIYPRSFMDSNGDGIGDLKGITSKLEYVKKLGVDVIWLSPICESPNDDNGYDISDYRSIMQDFGTMEDFEQMLIKAHSLGLRVVLDIVVNHTSDEHPWFKESRKSKDNPYRDYYIWRPAKEDGSEPNNWGACFSGSAWQMDEQTGEYYLHLFSKRQPDLNWDNPKVREEVFDMMNYWLDKGVDGFRMDAISLISKPDGLPDDVPMLNGYASFLTAAHGPHVHEYLHEMNEKVLKRRHLITVGECSAATVEESIKYADLNGSEFSMIFQFDHVCLDDDPGCKWSDRKMSLVDLKNTMKKWDEGLRNKAWNSLYWCNHDQPRVVSRLGNESDEYRELSAKMIATSLHMMQGTPYIFQGEELGMTNVPFESIEEFRDLESINAFKEYTEKGIFSEEQILKYLRIKSRDNARTPMQWDASKNAGFSTGNTWIKVNPNYTKINASEQQDRADSVFSYYQKLIDLRHKYDIITEGDCELIMPASEQIYAYERKLQTASGVEKLTVYCNFTDETVSLDSAFDLKNKEILISNYEDHGDMILKLRPYEAVVVRGFI